MTDAAPVRVGIVAAWPLTGDALGRLLEADSCFACEWVVRGREQALERIGSARTDVVVVDLSAHGDGLAVVRALVDGAPQSRIVAVVRSRTEVGTNARVVAAGARGLAFQTEPAEHFRQCVRVVARGEFVVDPQTLQAALYERRAASVDPAQLRPLSPREREVVQLVCEGLKNRTIGARLSISETTVRHHLSAIFEKTGVGDRLELVVHALRTGLASLPAGPGDS